MHDGSTEVYWDVLFDNLKFVKHDSETTTLYIASRYVLYEAKLLPSGGHAPRDHWNNIITIYLLSVVDFNASGLIASVQDHFKTSVPADQLLIRIQNGSLDLKCDLNQRPGLERYQIYPKHTVESVTELEPSVLTPPYRKIVPDPRPVRGFIERRGFSPHTDALRRVPPVSLPPIPPIPPHLLEKQRLLNHNPLTDPPAHPLGDPRYPFNRFGYNCNYSSAGESDPQRSHLYSFAAQHTTFAMGVNDRPARPEEFWECPPARASLVIDFDVPPPL